MARCDSTLPVSATRPPSPGSTAAKAGVERAHDEHVAGRGRASVADVDRAATRAAAGAAAPSSGAGAHGHDDAVVGQAERGRQRRPPA